MSHDLPRQGTPIGGCPASPAAIRLAGVAKTYRARRGHPPTPALRGVDLAVAGGEFVAIVGPSGCGKSTLLRIVAGLIAPDTGQVAVLGEAVRGPRSDVGVVFQRPVLLPWRTVAANVRLPAEVLRLPKSAARRREDALIDLVGLRGFADRYPAELSGGMQQRVGLARALAHDPPLLLLDEPFGALDALLREQMAVELQGIWGDLAADPAALPPVERVRDGTATKDGADPPATGRKTVLLVTHGIAEAVFLADRVAVMTPRPGTIAAILPIDLPRPRTIAMLDTEPFARHAARIRQALAAGG